MKNIVLIGMPGAGKSTIGVLLAKSLLCDFCDTDLIIQKQTGKSLCQIIEEKGNDGFLKIENDIIFAQSFTNCVIATGGSAVYGSDAMKKLKESSVFVFLHVDTKELTKRLSNIKTRGVAMEKTMTIEDLYRERLPLYQKYADISIDCTGKTAEECVEEIAQRLCS
ncbi:MAG: shikimate kinase [Acutalibacteraceae bacterium]